MKEKSSSLRAGFHIVAALVTVLLAQARADDDFRSWHSLTVREFGSRYVDFYAFGEARFRDSSTDFFQYLLSQRVVYKPIRFLDLGVNYTFLSTEPTSGGDFQDTQRLELEVNPRWPVNERLTLELRNRLELARAEGADDVNERSRHRLTVNYGLKFWKPFTAIYASEEVFFDYERDQISENRFVPLGLRFRLSPQVSYSIYYLLQSIHHPAYWEHNHVLGTAISVSF